MKKRTLLSLKTLLRLENGRVQLFNQHFYRVNKGKVVRQIPMYDNGERYFIDWGSGKELEEIFLQIKLLFDPAGKIVAIRTTTGESLIAKENSIWHTVVASKPKTMDKLTRLYEEQEAFEFYQWLNGIRSHCYNTYGKKEKQPH